MLKPLLDLSKSIAILHQKWRDLFFIHWEYDPLEIQKTLPKGLYVDTFEGKAYIGIVPFKMRDVHPMLIGPIPGIANFLELNVRTYVRNEQGVPGIWFYSLDANSQIALFIAKKFFHLPCFFSKMLTHQKGQRMTYQSERMATGEKSYFELFYQNHYRNALKNTLDFFLVERYLIYAHTNNCLYSVKISHPPYLISEAKILDMQQQLFKDKANFKEPIHTLFSPGVNVKISAVARAPGIAEKK